MGVSCCSRAGAGVSKTVHRVNEVREDLDGLSWSAQLAVYLMKAYELMAHCVGKFARAIVVLSKASGFLDAVQVLGKGAYFILGKVKEDVKRVCKIIGTIFMTVADTCAALAWLGLVGVKTLARHAAKIGFVGSVFALGGFAFLTGDCIHRLAIYSGKQHKGHQIANASLNMVSALAESAAIIAGFITGQIVVMLALGILAKSLSLTSFIFGKACEKKLKDSDLLKVA